MTDLAAVPTPEPTLFDVGQFVSRRRFKVKTGPPETTDHELRIGKRVWFRPASGLITRYEKIGPASSDDPTIEATAVIELDEPLEIDRVQD